MALDDEQFSELLEQGQALTDTAATAGWNVLVQEVEELARKKYEQVVGGKLDHDDYIRTTSWLEGARFVLSMPTRKGMEIAEVRQQLAELAEA